MSFTLRAAEPSDAAQILGIYAPVVLDTAISFEIEVPGVAEMAARIANASSTHAWIVAEERDALIGYAYASPHRSRGAYRWSADSAVYVSEKARRKGVAASMYRRLTTELTGRGFTGLFAGIALPNEPSVALHEAIGFRPVGVFRGVGYKLGAWRDVGWWQLDLADRPPYPREPTGPA